MAHAFLRQGEIEQPKANCTDETLSAEFERHEPRVPIVA